MGISSQWTGMRIKRQSRFYLCEKISSRDVGHSSGPASEKKWHSTHESKPQGEWGQSRRGWWWSNSVKADTQSSVPRVHCPEERSKAKVVENYRYTSVVMGKRLKLFSPQLFLLISLSIYGAVSDLREEYKSCLVRTGRLVLVGQYDPLFVPKSSLMKTPTPSTDDLAQEDLLQKVPRTSGLALTTKIVWLNFVLMQDSWQRLTSDQYFMTQDTEEFSQFTESVACREYTLPRDEKSSDPKDWIRGNTKIGPVLEVTTSYLQGRYGVEIRTESINKRHFSLVGQIFSWLE